MHKRQQLPRSFKVRRARYHPPLGRSPSRLRHSCEPLRSRSGGERSGQNRARFILLRPRSMIAFHSLFGGQLSDKVGDEAGPAGLVRSATAASIVTMEVLVKEDIVLEIGIALELFIHSENGTPAVGVTTENIYEPATQLISDFVKRRHDP